MLYFLQVYFVSYVDIYIVLKYLWVILNDLTLSTLYCYIV